MALPVGNRAIGPIAMPSLGVVLKPSRAAGSPAHNRAFAFPRGRIPLPPTVHRATSEVQLRGLLPDSRLTGVWAGLRHHLLRVSDSAFRSFVSNPLWNPWGRRGRVSPEPDDMEGTVRVAILRRVSTLRAARWRTSISRGRTSPRWTV